MITRRKSGKGYAEEVLIGVFALWVETTYLILLYWW